MRFYSGGQVKECTFSVSDDDEEDEEQSEDDIGGGGGAGERPIMDELHDYLLKIHFQEANGSNSTGDCDDDEDDEDPELVEEVYMEEHGLVVCEDVDGVGESDNTGVFVGDAVVEEYYADEDPTAPGAGESKPSDDSVPSTVDSQQQQPSLSESNVKDEKAPLVTSLTDEQENSDSKPNKSAESTKSLASTTPETSGVDSNSSSSPQ